MNIESASLVRTTATGVRTWQVSNAEISQQRLSTFCPIRSDNNFEDDNADTPRFGLDWPGRIGCRKRRALRQGGAALGERPRCDRHRDLYPRRQGQRRWRWRLRLSGQGGENQIPLEVAHRALGQGRQAHAQG